MPSNIPQRTINEFKKRYGEDPVIKTVEDKVCFVSISKKVCLNDEYIRFILMYEELEFTIFDYLDFNEKIHHLSLLEQLICRSALRLNIMLKGKCLDTEKANIVTMFMCENGVPATAWINKSTRQIFKITYIYRPDNENKTVTKEINTQGIYGTIN